ncbi:hypothetical protein WJX72_000025 [[Myrmecia] bisecta]|uniref:Bacterial surface antigen (D15) domain-containing protein n=1 Tax=[Myrmecia] bisecta TaxID=41462 RepID=A0AAW1PPA9_9CHLO
MKEAKAEEDEGEEEEEYEDEEEEGDEEEEEEAEEEEDDDDDEFVDNRDGFFCDNIRAEGLPVGTGIPTSDDLFAGLKCQPGFSCSRVELSDDLRSLFQSGLFDNVDARVRPLKKGKSELVFIFKEKIWPPMKSFQVDGAKGNRSALLLPPEQEGRVMAEHNPNSVTDMKALANIKNVVEGWYQDRGYVFSYISHFDGMDTGKIVAHITEGRVNRVNVLYVDDAGNPKKAGGETSPDLIMRELPFKEGQLYNVEDGKKALRDIFALGLFDNVQVVPKQNAKDDSKVDVDIMVKERPMRTAEVEAEWAIAPGDSGRPTLLSVLPGGSMTFENRNMGGKGRQLAATISTQNFVSPSDDLGFRLDYKHPYLRGANDPLRTALNVAAFNSRKLSGVFAPGPNGEEVPPVWIDRSGAKIGVSEQYSRNSKGSLGIVLEQVTARDEQGGLCTHGSRQLPNGMVAQDGPPTTLSDTGRDRLAFLQGQVTRDATYYVNGAQVGARDIFQVDQGLGIGSGNPFFNRHIASLTRFIQLQKPKEGSATPPVLVLHGRYGGTIGDVASYDTFTLGGPYSVRGYNVGELAACRNFLETAVELRVRLPVLKQNVYAFVEHGTDLGSSKLIRGNPTEYFRRAGSGTVYGAGWKLGAIRAEWIVDTNANSGHLNLRFGERF